MVTQGLREAWKRSAMASRRPDVKSADAFWTMPAGVTFTFEVKGETALLEAMTESTK